MKVTFYVNGNCVTVDVDPGETLLSVLRNKLGFKGVKEGCCQGECGACTVLVNGKPVNSCLLLIGKVEGANVLTVEGISSESGLHPLQRSFLEEGAVQCGFCTSGMIMSAYSLLKENPHPTEEEIKIAISGNLCRCTGYLQIIEAIKKAASSNH
ncbi:MAG: (2Fe-2S)-binding protein [Deltaproteobacteria bacterium]|nr:MAG: (2Fe-2S)-binding protein [Deltaproteobacteria bacterium]